MLLIVLTLSGLIQIRQSTLRSITGLIFLLQHGSSSFSNEDSSNLCTSFTSDPVKDWMKLIEGNKFSNPFSSLEGFCLTSCWPSDIKSDGMFVFCVGFVFVLCSCVSWSEIVWFELPWIVTLLSSITFKLTSLSTLLRVCAFTGPWPSAWPPIYIYRPWPPICIYRPWSQICIYRPWSVRSLGAKRPHCDFDFMNKIEVRSNTVFYQLGRLNNTRAQTF